MSFRFHPEARQELRDASHFYANAGRQVGLAFADAVERAIYNVRLDPSKFRELEPGVRIHRLQGFPYALLYSFTPPEVILILALKHDRRQPGYWRHRRENQRPGNEL